MSDPGPTPARNRPPRADEPLPRWVWRLSVGGAGLVILLVALVALALVRGAADPPVAGPVIWQDKTLAWLPDDLRTLRPASGLWVPAPEAGAISPGEPFTLTVRATLTADSDPSTAWGVWLAEDDGGVVIYALSGEGYTTTRRCLPGLLPLVQIEDCPAVRPEWRWSPYNRIRAPGQPNSITLHQESNGDIRLRINDEKLGAAPVDISGEWGVWARGGRDSGAVIVWESTALRGKWEQ